MSTEETKETRVYVDGKLVPLKELEKEYPEISLAGTPGKVRVIETLTNAEKPLSRKEIATRTKLSKIYARDILKSLIKQEYVLEFQMGGKALYYLLTEKGLKLAQEIVVQKV